MLYFDNIDVFERINVNKPCELKECSICHYWYLSTIGLQWMPDLLMMSMNLSNIAILNIKGSDCHCIISRTSKIPI